jgi:PleD family two-component response regulator
VQNVDISPITAERCRKLLGRKEIAHACSGVGQLVTVSMGVGTIVRGAQDDPDVFLDRIDRRLYQVKSGGATGSATSRRKRLRQRTSKDADV